MRRHAKLVIVGALVLGVSIAVADKLSDFPDAVAKTGCDSIPYGDLRGDCTSQQSYVHDYCDGSKGPVTCGSENITRQLKDNLESEKKNLEAAKETKRNLEDQRSRASDDNEKSRLDKDIEQADREVYEASKRVDQAAADLDARKKLVEDAIYTIDKCIDYRRAVMNVFASALDRVRTETAEDVKPYARQLRDKYEEAKRGHEIAITDKKNALETCESSRP